MTSASLSERKEGSYELYDLLVNQAKLSSA